jgi:hypothetical protein
MESDVGGRERDILERAVRTIAEQAAKTDASAMATWMDSNFNIHQKAVSLPAWFRVPAGVENYNAQRSLGDGGTIVCQLRWDDKVHAQSRSSGPYANCSVSA